MLSFNDINVLILAQKKQTFSIRTVLFIFLNPNFTNTYKHLQCNKWVKFFHHVSKSIMTSCVQKSLNGVFDKKIKTFYFIIY